MMGIYGGTFNPIHYGHLRVALEIKNLFLFNEIRFIPCYQPALKNQPLVNASIRLHMLHLAIATQPGFVCDSRELDRQGTSYMVETLVSLRTEFPQQSLVLLMGADAFAKLDQWYQWQQLFDYAHVLVMTRPNSPHIPLADFFKQRLTDQVKNLQHSLFGKLYFQSVTQLAISSTQIRALLYQDKSPRFLMPDNVINYSQQHKLYRNPDANP